MKYKLILIFTFILSIVLPIAGQMTDAVPMQLSHFQNVGGNFGKAWIENYMAQAKPPVQTPNNTSLWNWGGAPMGKMVEDGRLVSEDESSAANIRVQDWLGEAPLGEPVRLNGSYNLGLASPMSPLYLSDDPWIRAQQLETVVRTTTNYQPV